MSDKFVFDLFAEKSMFDLYAEKSMFDLCAEKPMFVVLGSLCVLSVCWQWQVLMFDLYAGKPICLIFMPSPFFAQKSMFHLHAGQGYI
jgi:hypothetical protein